MEDLAPPPHLWQFGLRDPAGRFFESIAVPLILGRSTRRFIIDCQNLLGIEYNKVPPEVAHVTLGGVESAKVPWTPSSFRAGVADVLGVSLTSYSIRMDLQQQPFADLAIAFGVPKATRKYGVTIAYAGVRIPALKAEETLGELHRQFLGARPLQVGFEFVEAQRRPMPSRDPFRYERFAAERGSEF